MFTSDNLLSNIFRNYPFERPIVSKDLKDRVLPDLEAIINQQVSDESPTGVIPGTYGNATLASQFTVNQFGELTFAANVPIAFPANFITSVLDTASVNLTVAAGVLSADFINTAGYITLTSLSATAPLTYNNVTGVFSTSMNTTRLIGRTSVGTGVVEELSVSNAFSLSALTLNLILVDGGTW